MKTLFVQNQLWVKYKGRIYSIPTGTDLSAEYEDTAKSELRAPFACKVVKLHVSDGEKVKKDTPIVTVEAMKMEYTYLCSLDGVIKKTLVTEGQNINQGQNFVEFSEE